MKKLLIYAVLLWVIGASGCQVVEEVGQNLPILATQAAQTALPDDATETPRPATPTEVILAVETNVVEQTPDATIPCYRAAAGAPLDVSVPDGTQFSPGDRFTKTWRLTNAGSCTWESDYSVVWFAADAIGVTGEQPLAETVPPGGSIDISVDMVVPEEPRMYQSYWKLRSADGELFGIGPAGDGAFWAQIEVVDTYETPVAEILPTTTPEPVVLLFGSDDLMLLDGYDLDKGLIVLDNETEIQYLLNEQQERTFILANGASMSVYGLAAPTFSVCHETALGTDSILVNNLFSGVYLCYRTSKGLPGMMRINAITEDVVTFEFVTWALP